MLIPFVVCKGGMVGYSPGESDLAPVADECGDRKIDRAFRLS